MSILHHLPNLGGLSRFIIIMVLCDPRITPSAPKVYSSSSLDPLGILKDEAGGGAAVRGTAAVTPMPTIAPELIPIRAPNVDRAGLINITPSTVLSMHYGLNNSQVANVTLHLAQAV
ncbi:hypothetical protein F5X96DRAFT_675638 [Biscogniauxia mediterranea]|nr:hypothetical protein F5X96DRAFT_675638 [Biscogniauxia mediterranea]